MRLLVHNILMCNVAKCTEKNYPLILKAAKTETKQSQFNAALINKTLDRLDWPSFLCAASALGDESLPKEIDRNNISKDEALLRLIHKWLFDTHVMQGSMTCPHCSKVYPIVNGIPNMIIQPEEM